LQERQEYAEQMQPFLAKYIIVIMPLKFRFMARPLLGASAFDIIKAHRSVRLKNPTN